MFNSLYFDWKLMKYSILFAKFSLMIFIDSKITDLKSSDAENDLSNQIQQKLSTPRYLTRVSTTRRSIENIDSGFKRINSK